MKKILILFLVITLLTGCTSVEKNSPEETPNSIEKKEIQEETLFEDSTSPINTEEDFTTYLEEVETNVEDLTAKETITAAEENTLKNTFITLTDFIFYGGTIKGITFTALTDAAKVKVLDLYSRIDAKIEEKLPNYKEKIKDTTKKTYTDIKSKLTALKESYKQSIGEERYNSQVETFEEQKEIMQDSFEPLIDVITEKSTDIYESTKENFNNWYQEWKRK